MPDSTHFIFFYTFSHSILEPLLSIEESAVPFFLSFFKPKPFSQFDRRLPPFGHRKLECDHGFGIPSTQATIWYPFCKEISKLTSNPPSTRRLKSSPELSNFLLAFILSLELSISSVLELEFKLRFEFERLLEVQVGEAWNSKDPSYVFFTSPTSFLAIG